MRRLELVGQIGKRGAERNDVLAHRGDMGIELVRDRIRLLAIRLALLGGFALLSFSSQSRTFGSASNVISSWIFSGVASLFAEAAGCPALGAAAESD